jgi:hypothetical protein
MQKIEQVALLKGFNITIDNQTIEQTLEIKPYDSFNLLVEANMSINITDLQGVAALDRLVQIKSLVSVEGMEDPLYLLNSLGSMSNTITKSHYIGNYTQLLLNGNGGCTVECYEYGVVTNDSTYPNFQNKILVVHDANFVANLDSAMAVVSELGITTPPNIPYVINNDALSNISDGMNVLLDVNKITGQGKVWYIDNFKKHVENSYYQSSQDGASYLDRLEGELEKQTKYSSQSNNEIGLESFIHKTVATDKTNIDYIYFSTSSVDGDKVKGITNPTNSFTIDNPHKSMYGIDPSLIE